MPLPADTWWLCVFFFSSRRRHTRYWRDWSSDVCSSDLPPAPPPRPGRPVARAHAVGPRPQLRDRRVRRGGGHKNGKRQVGEEGGILGVPDPLKKKDIDIVSAPELLQSSELLAGVWQADS